MKKIFAILFGASLLWSCNPLEDTYKQLDDAQEPYKESIEYTLVDADYVTASDAAMKDALSKEDSTIAKSIKSNLAFNSRFPGKDYIPVILSNNFPALSKGSSAKITYNEFAALPSYFADLSSIYTLTTSDYKKLWGSNTLYVEAFTPTVNVEDSLPVLLDKIFPDDSDGKYRFIAYNYSAEEAYTTGGLLQKVKFDFEEGTAYDPVANAWINKDLIGTKTWDYRSYSGNLYAQMSSYNSGEQNDVWLIRKFDKLDTIANPMLTFKVKVGYYNADCLHILISDDFDGNEANIATATWTDITSSFTLPQEPTSGYGASFEDAGSFDLSSYKGDTIYVAFQYVGNGTDNSATTTYQIDDVTISDDATILNVAETEKMYTAYTKKGNDWEPASDIFVLNDADYQELGFTNGYISTTDAQTYLPIYLKLKFPYTLDGEVKNVAFRNDKDDVSSATVLQFNKVNGEWTINDFLDTHSDQFFNDGTKWFFDPTIHLTLGASDYQLLVDWVYNNLDRSYGSSYGNDEFYFGASAYYSNFDLRLSKRTQYNIPGFEGLTEEEQMALVWKRLEQGLTILLSEKYPDAVSEVSGFPVYYWVYFKTFENDFNNYYYVGIFQKTKDTHPFFERKKDIEDEMVNQGKLTEDDVNWNRPASE
jgi:hypothetical protein